MKKQILSEQFRRMQKLAGILNENEDETVENKIQKFIDGGSKGTLDLSNTSVTSLPDNLKVNKLNLSDTPISSLPKGLEVEDILSLSNTKITSLPNDLKVDDCLILLYGTPIKSLPQNLTVGMINLNGNRSLKSLPKGLTVGSLNLSSTSIASLPKDIKVKDYLDIWDTPLNDKYTEEEIRKMAPGVTGDIFTNKNN